MLYDVLLYFIFFFLDLEIDRLAAKRQVAETSFMGEASAVIASKRQKNFKLLSGDIALLFVS